MSDGQTIQTLPPASAGASTVGASPLQPERGGLIIKKICGVYCFIHRPTLKCYIGSSVDIHKRKEKHFKAAATGKGSYFQRSLKELGIDSFDFEIIETCEPKIRFEREKFFIKFYNSVYPNGFNLNADPTNGWDYLYSDAMLAKISAACKGRICSAETRAKLSAALKGRQIALGRRHTPETIKKMIENHVGFLGKKHTAKTRIKIAEAGKGNKYCLGRKLSQEHRAKIGAASKGHFCSPETRGLMSATLKGNKRALGCRRSEETRARMSAAQMGNKNGLGCKRPGQKLTAETKAKISASGKIAWIERKLRMGNKL